MTVVRHNISRIGNNSTIYELIVVGVIFYQIESELCIYPDDVVST